MTSKKHLVLLFLLAFLVPSFSGCGSSTDFDELTQTGGTSDQSDNNGGGGGGDSPVAVNLRSVDVMVSLPQGVNLDLTTATLMSQLVERQINTDGSSTAFVEEGERVLTVLFDQSGNPILLGFVTDDKKEISVVSNAEVALFLALGTIFQDDRIKDEFLANVRSLDGFDDLVSQSEALFLNDVNFLKSDEFKTILGQALETILRSDLIDLRNRLVFNADTRSGVQIEEQPGDQITLVNSFRRRSHAFVYKVSSKDLEGNETHFIDDIAGDNPAPVADFKVGPTTELTSFIGTIQNAAAGKGLEYAAKSSDPVGLPLRDNESEATYKVRVVGPSSTPGSLSSQEFDKFQQLGLETMALDILLPVALTALGQDAVFKDFKDKGGDSLVTAFGVLASSIPGLNDAITSGNFKKASTDLFDGLVNGTSSAQFEDFYKAVVDGLAEFNGGFSTEQGERIIAGSDSLFKILDATDLLLQFADFGRIFAGSFDSNALEEWCVTSTRNQVLINPEESLAIQGVAKSLEAIVQDTNLAQGQAFEYKWSTSGAYGIIRDNLGKEGTSFTTSRGTIEYFSSSATSVPEGAMDTISVEVTVVGVGATDVGDAEATVEVRPEGFEIKPDGLTLNGGTSVVLSLNRNDGSDPSSSSTFEYRYNWSTSGTFGLFDGSQKELSRTDSNSVTYSALDKENEGTETFTASIYCRPKGSSESYRFVDSVDASLEIENDENTRIVLLTQFVVIEELSSTRIKANAVFRFAPVEDALSYSLRILEHAPAIPTFVGRTRFWEAGNPDDLEDGLYIHRTSQFVGSAERFNQPNFEARAALGLAELTIRLDPDR